MGLRKIVTIVALPACVCWPAISQTSIETENKPPSLVFKDATGAVVTSVPVDRKYGVPAVMMEISASANTAYVLNGIGKSAQRSISAADIAAGRWSEVMSQDVNGRSLSVINLATGRLVRVINVGAGKQVEMLISQDGRRLFCYTLSAVLQENSPGFAAAHLQKSRGSRVVNVIDTSSNQIIRTFDLLHSPGSALPKARFIESFLSSSPDAKYLLVTFTGFTRNINRPSWQRLALFSVSATRPPIVIDAHKPMIWSMLSENERFLFVASGDRADRSGVVHIVNVETGKIIDTTIDDPGPSTAHHRELSAFLGGTPPSWAGAKQGVWIHTRNGIRFISETGDVGNEISVPGQDKAAALLSLNRALWFVAVPDMKQHSGTLQVVNLKRSSISNYPLSDAPLRLIRLGSSTGLWLLGRQEMRPISETGTLGDRSILLNKPHKRAEADASDADLFLNGEPGETISLGEDRAAILVTSRTGGSVHRVALLNLRQLQLATVITTMSNREKTKIVGGRWLKMAAIAAAEGAAEGAILGGAGLPLNSFDSLNAQLAAAGMPEGLANEILAGQPGGRNLYVLDKDMHKVSVIDTQIGTVVGRIPVDKQVTVIHVSLDGRHLICTGPGFRRELDLERGPLSKS